MPEGSSRRAFFRALAKDVAGAVREFHKASAPARRPPAPRPVPPATDDDALREVVPILLPGVELVATDDGTAARVPGREDLVRLFRDVPAPSYVVSRFDGQTPLAAIAEELAGVMAWESDHAFTFTRGLYRMLVEKGVCGPGSMET